MVRLLILKNICADSAILPQFIKATIWFLHNIAFCNVRLRKSRHANICSKNQFFRENVVVIGFSELRPGSNERYENFTFYGPFRFLIFILILNKKTIKKDFKAGVAKQIAPPLNSLNKVNAITTTFSRKN